MADLVSRVESSFANRCCWRWLRIACCWLVFTDTSGFCVERDVPFDWGIVGLRQTMRQLQTTASVLHVVAHPDDEDGATMAYCARGLGMRTMLFSITRGEGGANLISADFFDELGALRTLEHQKAASFYGTQLFYSRAADYGYSKNLAEANQKWQDGRPLLEDLVEVIRRERPSIILSRFRGDEKDGHGHHQMAGVISRRAFAAAANPEYMAGTETESTWQVSRLYANNLRPEWRPADGQRWTLQIPTGNYDPLLGFSYAQIARYGLGFQRSQGISGHLSFAGPRSAYYRRLAPTDGADDVDDQFDADRLNRTLVDGIDVSIEGLALRVQRPSRGLVSGLEQLATQITSAVTAVDDQGRCGQALARGLAATEQLLEFVSNDTTLSVGDRAFLEQSLQQKQTQLSLALEQLLGIEMEALAELTAATAVRSDSQPELNFVTPGMRFRTNVRFVHQAAGPLVVRRIEASVPEGWQVDSPTSQAIEVEPNSVETWEIEGELSDDALPTRQAWSRESIAEPFYSVDRATYRQSPLPRPPMQVRLSFQWQESVVTLVRTVHVGVRDPSFGQSRYPLVAVPPVSVLFPVRRGVFSINQPTYSVSVEVRGDLNVDGSGGDAAEGLADASLHRATVSLELPNDWISEPESHEFVFRAAGETRQFEFQLRADTSTRVASAARSEPLEIRASCEFRGRRFSDGFRTITARDLDRLNLYRPAVHHVSVAELVRPTVGRVGYIEGSGDEVAASIRQLGIQPTLLDESQLATGDLSSFDVIVVGVRAYAVRDDVRRSNGRLLDYVHAGGRLIVQYQTPEFDQNFGPFPYSMGRNPEEVSEESATVTILQPEHRLFTTPNRISQADFEGWVEQRGSKFLTQWDDRYTPLLECHDAAQSPQRGGMLIAQYGKGEYIYSAYAWYRQLPYAVPGAYRLFANMLHR